MMLTLDETKSLVQILDHLRKAPDGLTSAFIVTGGIIGEDQEALGCEITKTAQLVLI
ncbi:hypothetical protein [Bifidobacterium sp. wkB338]|uniref:hypothetical protein n=1 Tax=Bifidobacterium sp. wkB338 TaxID=2025114 RepID=UPI001604DA08|nr:hypothetical protein [Bifidobacterium sp. wkB338]